VSEAKLPYLVLSKKRDALLRECAVASTSNRDTVWPSALAALDWTRSADDAK
jgi:hypothetical protein